MNIRKATVNDLDKIKELLEKTFNKEFPLPFLKWKYFNNIFKTMNFIGEKNGEVICHYGAIFFPYSLNKSWIICMPCDAASNYKYNSFGKNIPFVKFSQYVYNEFLKIKNVKFIFSFTGERHARLSQYIINGQHMASIVQLKAPFKKILQINFLNSISVKKSKINDVIDENFVGIKRDKTFFKWRYLKHPFKIYNFFTAEQFEKTFAFFVIYISNNTFYIEDFLISKGSEHLFFPSIVKICKNFYKFNISEVIIKLSSNHPLTFFLKNTEVFKEENIEPKIYPMYFGNMNIEIPVNNFIFTMAEMEL